MRLLRLDLIRYGHLADVSLDFPRSARLHVVLGPNEAGKSTALRAIGDALFGFPARTDFAFQFDTAQLRLGFELEAADGTHECFLRRKGNKGTLLDRAEQVVPDAALARLLGGASRGLFETTYGLNGETLRQGSLALLASGGEAGESLLAGMGLQNLRGALERLDEQAKSLAGSRKHNQALTVALDGYKRAREAAEEAAIRPREWAEARAGLETVQAQLLAARTEAAALREEASRLRRVHLVRPVLAQLDVLRAEHAGLADAPALPADAAARLERLLAARRRAEEDATREAAEAARLEAERTALPQDPEVLAVQDALDALAGRRAAIADALEEVPALERKVAALREQVVQAAAQLGSEAAPEALRDAVPPQAARQKVQRLLVERTRLATTTAAAARAVQEAERRHAQAGAMLAGLPAPRASAPLRRAIGAARAEGPLDRELAGAERRLAEAARQTEAALAALPLWSGDAAALAALKLPLEPAVTAQAERLAAARAGLEAARDAVAQIDAEARRLDGEVVQLSRGETVPTREVIAAARARRDHAWRILRGDMDGTPEPRDGLPDGPLPTVFEALRDEADRLADARADDAQRVAAFAEKTARLRWLADQREAARAAVQAAETRRTEAETGWAGLWAPAGLAPADPAAMQAWDRQRAEVLRLAAMQAEAAARRDDLACRIATARDAVLALLPDAAAPTLAALLDHAEAECQALEAAERAHRELSARVAQDAARIEEARAAGEGARAELAAFEGEWRAALLALGLRGDAPAEAVEGALDAWGRIAEAATTWRSDARRLGMMRAAADAFARDAQALSARLGEAPHPEPAPIVVARLARRLSVARDAARDAASLARQARERLAAAGAAQRRLAEAEHELDALRALAGAADLEALEAAIRRAARRDELALRIAALADDLLRQGDGLEEARLREETGSVDPDRARVRLEEIEADEVSRAERLIELSKREQAAESRLATLEAGRDAAVHAQEARQHLAAAQEAAERYARLHVARELLKAGIERLRQERQGPLLRTASEHFARLTAGRYPRLETDETDSGQVVLRAVRADRSACPVDKLSEGTRDQLYLALRVAAVEQHAQGAEPLPFIADDLLASFDDGRAGAALALLAHLGERVQAILFTHHTHLAALAARLPGVSVQTLPAAALPAA